ncbi:hypothetical protein, partial [Escherichia coli]|uniref:hypothetical protein n=1 Tax=Escherichia coli TaxID=562 RepID=UPI00200C4029
WGFTRGNETICGDVDRVDGGLVEEAERCAQLQGWGDEVVPGLQLQVPVSRTEGKELLAAQAAPGKGVSDK